MRVAQARQHQAKSSETPPSPGQAPLAASISPDTGERGSKAKVTGEGFRPNERVRISFALEGDGSEGDALRDATADNSGAVAVEVTIPSENRFYGTPLEGGPIRIVAIGLTSERATDTYYELAPR